MRTRPALALAVLAPLIGEYLLGNVTIRQFAALPFLAPMYGGGALLIREVARRTGRGWPTILVLGLAYGLIEPGVFDGSLFASTYEGMDYTGARVPLLGLSAFYALQFVVNHAVWSITIPILLAETLVGDTRPWLGRVGLGVTAAVYVGGGLLIRSYVGHHTSWPQAAGVLLLALVLVAVAVSLPHPAPGRSSGWVPRPWLVGLAAFLASCGYFLLPATWRGVATAVKIVVGAVLVVGWLSRRAGWHTGHRVALATGALLTYAWAGFLLTAVKHHADRVAFAGNGVLAAAAIVLCVVAAARVRDSR